MNSPSHFSYKAAVKSALNTIFNNLSTFFYLGLIWWGVYALLSLIIGGMIFMPYIYGSVYLSALPTVFYFISYVVEPYIHYQLLCLGLSAHRGESLSIKKAFSYSLRNFLYYYAARLLLSIEIFVGLILLLIPGAYIGLKHYFAGYSLLEDPTKKISEDSKISSILTQGVKWRLLLVWYIQVCVALASLVLSLLSVIMPPVFFLSVILSALLVLVDLEIFNQLKKFRLSEGTLK
jgi:hypothetical protein